MKNLFNNTPYGIPGNEDCGQMSAWYIFSAMGFYPVAPASGEYAIGSPALKRATMRLSNGSTFTMTAENLSPENIYVQSVMLNGKPWTSSFLPVSAVTRGGMLKFSMGPKPRL